MTATKQMLHRVGLCLLLAPLAGAAPAQPPKSTRPARPAVAKAPAPTPESTLRAFFVAMLEQDAKTLRKVTLPVSDADFKYLLKSEMPPPGMIKEVKAQFATMPIKAMKAGDTLDLPSGKTLTVPSGMVGADRALLLPPAFPLPLPLQQVNGQWRVGAASLIAARKGAERARKAPNVRQEPATTTP